MRALIAWASAASPNFGVRALAQGSIDLLRRVWPDTEVESFDFGSNPRRLPLGKTRSLFKERALGERDMMAWLSGFDLYWDTRSGDSFTDIYGLARHRSMTLMHEFASEAGAQAVLAPQTIGPFGSFAGRALGKRTLRRSSLVFARDTASATAAASLGRTVDATATDLVFGIEQPPSPSKHDVLLNVSGLLWQANPHVDHLGYRAAIRSIIAALRSDGRSVTLLPHVIDSPGADNDVPVSRALVDEYEGALEIVVPTGLADARAAMAGANLVIGARMHACLNALSTGTPAIAMAYSRKFGPLMRDLGWDASVPLNDDADTATSVIRFARDESLRAAARDAQQLGQQKLSALREQLAHL